MKELLKNKKVVGLIIAILVAAASGFVGFDVKESICDSEPAIEQPAPASPVMEEK